MKDQLVALDRPAEIHLHPKAFHGGGMHRRIEQLEPSASMLFRAVHRQIGAAKQMLGRVLDASRQGDADAGRGEHL